MTFNLQGVTVDTCLDRQLLYTEKTDFGEIRGLTPLVDQLYPIYIDTKDAEYRWKPTVVKTFNEVLYQCTRIMQDETPEDDVYFKYLGDVKDTFGTRYASNFVFSLVYVVLSLGEGLKDRCKLFLLNIEQSCVGKSVYFSRCYQFVQQQLSKEKTYKIDLSPKPTPPDRLRASWLEWQRFTCDFSQRRIMEVLNHYQNKEDLLCLVDIIENSWKNYIKQPKKNSTDDLPF